MKPELLARYWIMGLLLLAGCETTGPLNLAHVPRLIQPATEPTPLDRSAAQLENDTQENLAWAEALRTRIADVTGRRTIDNTLAPYNEMMMRLDAAQSECGLFARVHPDKLVREAGEAGEQSVVKYRTELKLDRTLYTAFRKLDVSGADAATQFLVYKILRDFRRAGVDKSADARVQIARLSEEIVKLGQEFGRNTREDEREIAVDSPAELEGLPPDWIIGWSMSMSTNFDKK